MSRIILSPPVLFIVILVFSWLLSFLSSTLAFRRKGAEGALRKSYAGGEEVPSHRVQPDYSQFFQFAFFFTILHVVALMIATIPTESFASFGMAIIYLLGALTGLTMLFKR